MSQSPRPVRVTLDAALVERFESLASAAMERFPEAAYLLVTKLSRARLVAASKLPDDCVTIGSNVSYQDERTGRAQQVTLVLPEQADISRGLVSVLTPVGVALLGLRPGNRVRWETRAGEERALSVLAVARDSAEV